MSTTTVRLSGDDEQILDTLAPEFGGRSNVIRQAIRFLAKDVERRQALDTFLNAWETEQGPVSEDAVAAMADRYGL